MNVDIERLLKDRYFLKDETTWDQLATRVSAIYPPILDLIRNMQFVPSSPTLMNANTKGERRGTLSSCFPMKIEDSIEGIGEAQTECMIVTKYGGGVGYGFDALRSSKENIQSINRNSSGPLGFISIFNTTLDKIQQGGVRRGAGMAVLNVYHPDILEFIMAKDDLKQYNRLNFSIGIPDPFYADVLYGPLSPHMVQGKTGEKFPLTDKDGNIVTVGQLWDMIIYQAWKTAEPGIFNSSIAYKQCTTSNLSSQVIPNPCSEFVNIPYSSCNLGSLDIVKFLDGSKFNWERLSEAVVLATTFLDSVIDVNNFPLKKIKQVTQQIRPIGLGIMGLAHCFYKKRIPYNSDRAYNFVDELMRYITLTAMETSVKLAEKEGAYPAFDFDLFMQSNERFFTKKSCRDIDVDALIKKIKKHGVRNSCFTSIAPTGSISMIAETSSGIEPVFALTYSRTIEQEKTKYDVFVTDPIFKQYIESNFSEKEQYEILKEISENKGSCQSCKKISKEAKEIFVVAGDLTPMEHLTILQAAARNTSLSVSKTINLPNDAKVEDVAEVYLKAHELGIIGVTVYRDGCREGVLNHIKTDKVLDIEPPKRPKSLPHDVYRITVHGEKWVVFVGLKDEKPFEVFAGRVNLVDMPSSIGEGIVTKISGGTYQFEYDGEVLIKDITKIFENDAHEALTRMISTALQTGTPISKIVYQLQKSKGTIVDFSKSIIRALKKYVPDGDTSAVCPTCGSKLVYLQGCIQCSNPTCGYSKCG